MAPKVTNGSGRKLACVVSYDEYRSMDVRTSRLMWLVGQSWFPGPLGDCLIRWAGRRRRARYLRYYRSLNMLQRALLDVLNA